MLGRVLWRYPSAQDPSNGFKLVSQESDNRICARFSLRACNACSIA